MGEIKANESAADLLDEFAALVEFKKPVIVAPVEDEDVALGIRGHCDGFTEVLARRKLQEVRNGSKRNLRDVLDGRLALGKRQGECQDEESDRREKHALHKTP
jgi:hypothetical protein